MHHQFTVTSQACGGISQQPGAPPIGSDQVWRVCDVDLLPTIKANIWFQEGENEQDVAN